MTTSDYLDPLYFRNDLVRPLFDLVRAGESFAVVAPASMGKSRLTRFIMRDDVQRHALGEQASTTRLVLCDFNRLAEVSDWGMYEVILASLIEACDPPAREPLLAMQRDVITSHNGLLAQRHVELAALMLTREHGLKLCLLLDEFDELCRKLSPLALSSLRALRDANKYQVCFGTFVRDHPARLRPPLEYEGFYELLSRSVLWLGPYQSQDALDMIDLLARRRQRELAPEVRHRIVNLGGGHPGMTNALFDVFSANPDKHRADFDINAMLTGTVEEEAHKLWDSLADDERLALSHVATGIPPNVEAGQLLLNKGILCSGGDGFTVSCFLV